MARDAARPLVILAATFTYIAIALIPGPRRLWTGLEAAILIGVGTTLVLVLSCRPRLAPYLAGIFAVVAALAASAGGPDGLSYHWEVMLLFPLGWTLIGSSAWSWRAGAATYVWAGLWTLALLAWPDGIAYFDGPFHDADQFVYEVVVPIAFWPSMTFGLLGVFGMRFV